MPKKIHVSDVLFGIFEKYSQLEGFYKIIANTNNV